jgi:hypothetical protein
VGVDREEVRNSARARERARREGAAASGAGGDAGRHRGKVGERKKTGTPNLVGKRTGTVL